MEESDTFFVLRYYPVLEASHTYTHKCRVELEKAAQS
jgi:hypothetical protein